MIQTHGNHSMIPLNAKRDRRKKLSKLASVKLAIFGFVAAMLFATFWVERQKGMTSMDAPKPAPASFASE